ncbi:tRNA lysidine(34) synthetase TilS, partial [Bdellovibrionota bacterium]
MKDLLEKVKKTIQRHSLIRPGDRVVMAVSGGIDSVSLLDLLCRLRQDLAFDITVAHVNHGLRGKDADNDAEFVRSRAKELNVPFYIKKIDVSHLQTMLKGSPQEIAREERLRYLEQLAEKIDANRIALGHNRDDQAETVLMRMIRGAGARGLRGMGYSRDKFIRPLLDIKREGIKEYSLSRNISHVEDKSNLDDIYLRNKIRLKLMPLLEKEYNPEVKSGLIRLASILREEDRFLDKLCRDLFRKNARVESGEVIFEIPALLNLDVSLRARILRMGLHEVKRDLRRISYHHYDIIEELIHGQAPQKQLDLPEDINVIRIYSRLIIARGESSYLTSRGRPFEYRLKVPGFTKVRELGITVNTEVIHRRGHRRGFVF